MKHSSINFDEKFISLIRDKKKTLTSRLIKFNVDSKEITPSLEKELIQKCAWDIGQIVDVTTNNISTLIKIRVDRISVQHVSQISQEQAINEGFSSQKEYIDEISRIYGDHIKKDDPFVWVIHFSVVSIN